MPRIVGSTTSTICKAMEDWTLERQFRRVPRIGDVTSFGGTVKRYEIQPDPDLMKRYGITLPQLQNAIAGSNDNVGGDYVVAGRDCAGRPQPRLARRRPRSGRSGPRHERSGQGPQSSPRPKNSAAPARFAISCWPRPTTCPFMWDDVVEGGPRSPDDEPRRQRSRRWPSDAAGKGDARAARRRTPTAVKSRRNGQRIWGSDEDDGAGDRAVAERRAFAPRAHDVAAKIDGAEQPRPAGCCPA